LYKFFNAFHDVFQSPDKPEKPSSGKSRASGSRDNSPAVKGAKKSSPSPSRKSKSPHRKGTPGELKVETSIKLYLYSLKRFSDVYFP